MAQSATQNSGIRKVIPGARRRCTVAMKFSPVKIDEKPRMNAASTIVGR